MKYYSKYYHDLISAIRIHNGQVLLHDKLNNHILFEVKFHRDQEAAAFGVVLKSTQALNVK